MRCKQQPAVGFLSLLVAAAVQQPACPESVDAQAPSAPSSAATDIALSAMESRLFSVKHSQEAVAKRLERLETMVFGARRTGSEEERTKSLLGALGVNPSSPKSAGSAMIQGRLEEIAGAVAELPAGLSSKGRKTPLLKGSIASYPEEWLGHWGGHLNVSWFYGSFGGITFANGTPGVAVFSFVRDGSKVRLLPTNIVFPAVTTSMSSSIVTTRAHDSGAARSGSVKAVPELDLRESSYFSSMGGKVNSSVVRNTLRSLKPDVVEQDIVVGSRRLNAQGGFLQDTYKETVIRLTRCRDDLLWAAVVHVGYGTDRQVSYQIHMQGWLTDSWKRAALEMEKIEGRSIAEMGYRELVTELGETSTNVRPKTPIVRPRRR
jgi:hypothetical protein